MTEPSPFSEFVVKIAGRCNLNCSYCYMFNLGDDSWHSQPKKMSVQVRDALVNKVVSHAKKYSLKNISFGLHGGEPLLYGKKELDEFVSSIRSVFEANDIKIRFKMQTNATLVDEEWVEILFKNDISVGVSIDGPKEYHDVFRVDHQGRGSFEDVKKGIKLLQSHEKSNQLFPGVICVINPNIPPKDFFDFILDLKIRWFDVRLPLNHYSNPPVQGKWAYGDWLVEVFDLWFAHGDPNLGARFYSELLMLLLGSKGTGSEITGQLSGGLVVIETDGGIEPSDNLKACGDGFTKQHLNVLTNELDEAFYLPLMQLGYAGHTAALPQKCQECPYVKVCGGGLLANRYSKENDFDNPTYFCEDTYQLIEHIQSRVLSEFNAASQETHSMTELS
jgi:uncharacterized protein